MKRICCFLICIAIVFSMGVGTFINASAAGKPYVTSNLPKTMKIGESLRDIPDPAVHYHNLKPGENVLLAEFNYKKLNELALGDHRGGDPWFTTVDSNGNADSRGIDDPYNVMYNPGTLIYYPKYLYTNDRYASFDDAIPVGNPISIVVEEPIITHNAPSSIKINSTLNFKTQLTNTALTDEKVSKYAEAIAHDTDPHYMMGNEHMIAYRPIVEVIEGKEIVKQTKQDYTNTLHTSETLSFNGIGTVKLKVTYRQINTCGMCLWSPYDGDCRRNFEKIITIKVTDNNTVTPPTSDVLDTTKEISEESDNNLVTSTSSLAPNDSEVDTGNSTQEQIKIVNEETRIKLEAELGIVPPDTIIDAKEITQGEKLTIVKNALENISSKWVAYDICLMSNNAEIQPNGNVKITIPLPSDLSTSKIALYHIAEDGKLEEVPFSLDKDNIVFETNHFSLFAIAENENAVDNSNSSENDSKGIWITFAVVISVLIVVTGIVLWTIKVRKKH